jgi:translocator protein
MRSALALVAFLVLCFGAAWIGLQLEPGAWYQELQKPSWNPPAWGLLYLMMAVAGWLVWRERGRKAVRLALAFFVLQLALNAAWSWLFFGLNRPDLAFVEIVVLWLAILATAARFWRVRRAAGVLLLPYLAWVGFAGVLNLVLWRMN